MNIDKLIHEAGVYKVYLREITPDEAADSACCPNINGVDYLRFYVVVNTEHDVMEYATPSLADAIIGAENNAHTLKTKPWEWLQKANEALANSQDQFEFATPTLSN